MGLNNHYRSVSTNDESFPLNEKPVIRAGWGKQSIFLSIATGTLFIAIVAAVLSMVSSVFVSHESSSQAVSTSTNSPVAAVASSTIAPVQPTVTPNVDDDSSKAVDDTPEAPIQNCGHTPDEARANGCIFDVMMQLWTPAACFDEVLSNRFLDVGNWTWYADGNADHIFTLEEMRKGEHDAVYVAQDYHVTHCIYAWEKLVRAMRNQDPLITELISYDHVIHCRHKTLQRQDGGGSIRGVRAPTGWTQCAPYDTWKNHLPHNEHSSVD